MIKSVTITNPLGESLKLELTKPEESGIIVKSIGGLGPVKADVHTFDLATLDGSLDNGARLGTRNIVFSLEFTGISIESIRQKTYRYFPIKQNITMTFITDNRECYTTGRVESNEPDIFSKNEGCQISVLCPNSYFYKLKEDIKDFFGENSIFEFPFENNSSELDIVDSNPVLEMGEIQTMTGGNIYYEGDAEVGIIIQIHAIGNVSGFTIYNMDTRESMSISDTLLTELTGSGIIAGDTITINTNKGSKSVNLLRNGETINVLNVLGFPIDWFVIRRGDNRFTFYAEKGVFNLQIKILYTIAYEGI